MITAWRFDICLVFPTRQFPAAVLRAPIREIGEKLGHQGCGPIKHGASGPPRVQRGGSYLCDASYCAGYRVAARMATTPETGLSHAGFRCVVTR